MFIPIHCNAFNCEANGTEVWRYYCSRDGKQLAECIQQQIVDALGTVNRGAKGAVPGENGLYVLTNTDAVAVLVECAFIDNAADEKILLGTQDDFARAIARDRVFLPCAIDGMALDGMAAKEASGTKQGE